MKIVIMPIYADKHTRLLHRQYWTCSDDMDMAIASTSRTASETTQ